MEERVEIAIIGAGPGGIGAATNAAKKGISHLLIEKSEIANTIYEYQLRKLVMAEPRRLPLRSYVPFDEGSREQVLEGFINALNETGVKTLKGEVTAITNTNNEFEISVGGSSRKIISRNIILAIGSMGTPRKLGVPGEDKYKVEYTLSDPDAFINENILVVGAGDSAIENALALSAKNKVSIINRSGEFPRAKDANRAKILDAIKSKKVACYYNSQITEVKEESIILSTPDGDIEIPCNRVIVRAGSVPPRKFVESCGVVFPTSDISSVPVVNSKYESNVSGIYIIGSLIGYPLIKQAINQGYEVIEHIIGNPIDPADQILIDEVLSPLGGDTKEQYTLIRRRLRLFIDLSDPQFREMLIDSKIRIVEPGEVIFQRNDYTDTFFNVISGSVAVEDPKNPKRIFKIVQGNFFGEMGLISGRRRTATVHALERTALLETKRNQVLKLMASVPSVKDAIDRVFFLRALKTSVFPDADSIFLAEVVQEAKPVSFKKGEVIFKESDAGDAVYVILKGSVKISRRNKAGIDIAQTYLSAGNYFGEMALITGELRNATVSAAVPCNTLKIERETFLKLLEKDPETKAAVLQLAEERKIENITSSRDIYSGEVLNFVLSEGVSDADNVLLIDSDRCIGCDNCEKACAATHNGYSRLDRKGGKSFASIQVPISCRHCENPLCMTDCPPDALERQTNGEVIIKDSCIGCGNCITNCPYGVIQLVYDVKQSFSLLSLFGLGKKEKGPAKAAKCDMCAQLPSGPACVRSCPTGAAMRLGPEDMMSLLINRGGR